MLPVLVWLFLAATFLAACATTEQRGLPAKLSPSQLGEISSNGFTLTVVSSPNFEPTGELRLYLGGDGIPWTNGEPSQNPTGSRSLAIDLMLKDPLPALYLGRPCFHQLLLDTGCSSDLWASGRYSLEVVETLEIAIRELARRHEATKATLIGYSGGGVLAVLIAARMADQLPTEVITVAANLDIAAWTQFHNLLPLASSLNPAEAIAPGGNFGQLHFQGEKDRVVPAQTTARYFKRHQQARRVEIEDFDHVCCWHNNWPELLRLSTTMN